MEKKYKKETFMQGVMALMFSQVLIKILGLVYKLYLTNKEGFGDTGNAIYSSGFQIYALLLTLSSIGVPNAISKLVSERVAIGDHKGAHRIFKISFFTFACVGLFGTAVLFLGANYISNVFLQIPEAELTLVALSPSIFFVSISSVIRGYFNGRGTLKPTANSQTLEQLLKTVTTIALVEIIAIFSGTNTVIMAAGANLATSLSIFMSFIYLYAYYKIRNKEIYKEIKSSVNFENHRIKTIIKKVLTVSIPISLSSLLSAVNKNIDSVTVVRGLKKFLTEAEAKFQYGILSGKVDTLTSLPLSFNIAFATALVPAISSSNIKGEKEVVIKRISFSLLVTMLIGLPCTAGMFVFSEQILKLLFPNATAGTLILQVSAITIIFTVLAQTVNGALQGLGKVTVPAIALGCGVFVKFICNIVLVPITAIGAVGAAIGSVVCHIISFIIGFTVLNKNLKLKIDFLKFVFKPILATAMMSILSYYLYNLLILSINENIATVIILIFAVIIYTIIIFILKIFSKEEILMLPFGKNIYNFLGKLNIYSLK